MTLPKEFFWKSFLAELHEIYKQLDTIFYEACYSGFLKFDL